MPAPAANGAKAGQYPVRQAGATDVPPSAGPPAQPGGTPPPVVGVIAPQAPFTLTPAAQTLLDEILAKWEQQSNRISTFTCKFGRWEVNETFGPAEHHFVLSEAHGEIKFKSPDHGVYIISDQTEWDRNKNAYAARTEGLDHWVCDGKSIYEFDQAKKQLIERQLDPSMQGKAITDGPLPFVFGTKADQLKRRYWMKDITPADQVNKQVWLEAWPKFQRDAANFQHAIIVLNQSNFMPSALRIILPDGKNKQDYSFEGTSVNNPLANLTGAFWAPRPPLGWTKVVIPAGGAGAVPPPNAAPAPAQAQQPRASVQRQ
jgi:TIGR03009 family protein